MARTDKMRILGVMTGTSCDGLDAACIEINMDGWNPLWSSNSSYPASLGKRVLEAQNPGFVQSSREWLLLNRDLGNWYAATLRKLISKKPGGLKPQIIANHGQTISHFPREGLTLQMGDPSRISQVTGLTVVASFREGDLAAGGQGAPLAPLFHQLLAHALTRSPEGIAIHNLGGISNLTYIGPRGTLIAFDTGPANLWIDAAADRATRGHWKMDINGKLACEGKPDERAVKALLKHPYFRKKAPKSTGRDEFTSDLFFSETRAKGADLVATATAVSIESIAQAYETAILRKKLPLRAIYFCGGGANNPSLLQGIQARLPSIQIRRLQDFGFDAQLVEAQAFAFFGFVTLLGQPLGGAWTGARGFGPPAHIIPGENWAEVMTKLRGNQSRES